ncbi:quinoprotein glucose dehydrogenase [Algoriphagus ratkowskyi]|uniref:PQQ-binding-like beta-propeller repeat protein n=1 Tax=Algoriphagus ratkowskyi TaxID=57028 RepID=A0A2W7RMQ0_9BACT|nr:PQQ-binding-like beta-propeller repeat protein [Algoriphagus ratkowskyi]PZX59770.1 quinoprotein glucose dehydrogenase [Algoriphagus ratkowskyi]TXD78519.1 PQQ-binding-like beta-propeller repeat protein [Algoriphagus ratkowskyi]
MKALFNLTFASFLFFSACQNKISETDYTDWSHYGGPEDGSRYSSLAQITRENVAQLEVAWTYNTGDATERSQIQCQPIVVNGLLYGSTPSLDVFAINAATGDEVWRFDPFEVLGGENSWAGTNRGVSYWEDGDDKRILFGAGNWLMAVDAGNGEPILSFGDQGKVDLRKELDSDREDFLIVANAPGVVYGDLLIIGMRLSEGLDAAPGHIRAYNIRTGKREWIFHTIPQEGELGYDTWNPATIKQIGGANNWAGMTVDQKRGIVFVPTGSATYDFWGGYRKGDNLYANSLIALNAQTGKRIWHFQGVHHDIWDRDFPANPNLIRIQKEGKWIDAVAQISKQGLTYVFDRETGEPVWPIIETEVTQSVMPGEHSSPTQPIPTFPEPFMNMVFGEKDILNLKPEWEADIRSQLEGAIYGDTWAPPHPEKSLVLFPGMDGGGEWGGASFDPTTQTLYVNANQIPWIIGMKPNADFESVGKSVYTNFCGNCHGLARKGNPPAIPSLLGLKERYSYDSLDHLLRKGRGAMPAFDHISSENRKVLLEYLLDKAPKGDDKQEMESDSSQLFPRYYMDGYKKLVTKEGLYGSSPPWGLLTAINMNTGKKKWQVTLGEIDSLSAQGFDPTGTENYGGPVVTAGGILFIAATKDEKIRAFDKDTGEILWEAKLPASGHATPAVYEMNGKQYLVIACGGGKGTKSGDAYVAFALPE